ncbi:MAG TPA: UDP-galactopyranose mutase [Ruminiclostridium sp.]|nr:UDP-galactopyranose mutase [Ruminiclostridium sp.]
MNRNFDVVIVGCGFSGAASARALAEKGKHVLILEKRNHIAGNMFDFIDNNGVMVHKYGPHIFHTSNKAVFEFLGRFSEFFPYEHRVIGKIDGQFVPIPFNFKSADILFGKEKSEKIKNALKEAFDGRERVTVNELLKGAGEIKAVGEYVFEKVFLHYTAKQWGMPTEKVDKSVLNRVPVVFGYDDRYFSDTCQYMPKDGYTKLFENMLDHENITIKLNTDAGSMIHADAEKGIVEIEGEVFENPVIWTAPADELFGYKYGRLPYRSLDLKFEQHEKTWYQPAAVVNYPNEEEFTRITEFKYLTGQKIDGATTIMKEYPLPYDQNAKKGNIPYYPVVGPENQAVYNCYLSLAQKVGSLYLCGRLAQYRYYNMDAAVAEALILADRIQ